MTSAPRHSTPRELIHAVLQSAGGPLRADELWKRGRDLHPGLGLATVYRTLKVLRNAGELRQVTLATGVLYEKRGSGDHPHFLCRRCQTVYDLPSDLFRTQTIHLPFKIEGYELTLLGLCAACAANTERITP